MEATKQDEIKVEIAELVETVHCPITHVFMPLEKCRKCEKHNGIETQGKSPFTKRDLRTVICLVPAPAEVHAYVGDSAFEVVNCGPYKTLRPLAECVECRLHGGVMVRPTENGEHKEALCNRERRRPCSYLAIGLKEV